MKILKFKTRMPLDVTSVIDALSFSGTVDHFYVTYEPITRIPNRVVTHQVIVMCHVDADADLFDGLYDQHYYWIAG